MEAEVKNLKKLDILKKIMEKEDDRIGLEESR